MKNETKKLHPVVSRLYLQTKAGCHRQWSPNQPSPNPGCDSHYLHWLIWEEMGLKYGITAEEADAAWESFLERHGDNYPDGDWQDAERAYMRKMVEDAATGGKKGRE